MRSLVIFALVGCSSPTVTPDAPVDPDALIDASIDALDAPPDGPPTIEIGAAAEWPERVPGPTPGNVDNTVAAWNGTDFLIGWRASTIEVTFISVTGQRTSPTNLRLSPVSAQDFLIACSPQGTCIAAWKIAGTYRIARIAANGTLIDTTPYMKTATSLGIGVHDTGFVIASSTGTTADAMRLPFVGALLDATPLALAPDRRVAGIGCYGTTCWVPGTGGIARVSADGSVGLLATGIPSELATSRDITCNASFCLVATVSGDHVLAARMTLAGVFADPSTFQIDDVALETATTFDVAIDGADFVVAMETAVDEIVRRVPVGDPLTAPSFRITSNKGGDHALACSNVRCLLADGAVFTTRFEANVVLDLTPTFQLTTGNSQERPLVAIAGGEAMVGFRDLRVGATSGKLVRWSLAGTALDATARDVSPDYRSFHHAGSYFSAIAVPPAGDLRADRLSAAGAVLGSTALGVRPQTWSTACVPEACLFAYRDVADRMIARRLDAGVLGPALDLGPHGGTTAANAVVATGTDFVVMWSTATQGALSAVRITSAGVGPTAQLVASASNVNQLVATTIDDTLFVAWREMTIAKLQTFDTAFAERAPAFTLGAVDSLIGVARLGIGVVLAWNTTTSARIARFGTLTELLDAPTTARPIQPESAQLVEADPTHLMLVSSEIDPAPMYEVPRLRVVPISLRN